MTTSWARPGYELPKPSFEFLLHLECDMEEFHMIGSGPHGTRATVIFKGGRFGGPKLRGTILPGGGDWEIVAPNATAYLDTRYNLKTDDGAIIYVQTTGVRKGAKHLLEKLGEDESITVDQYSMRLNLKLECGDDKYSWLNDLVCFAMSGRSGNRVIYDAYVLK